MNQETTALSCAETRNEDELKKKEFKLVLRNKGHIAGGDGLSSSLWSSMHN